MSRALLFSCMILCIVVGCGDNSAAVKGSAAVSGSHGGFAAAIPNEKGVAEVLVELGKPAKPGNAKLVVYFLSTDGKAPAKSLPTEASVKIIPPVGDPITAALKIEPKTGDPTSSARFATAPGKFDYDDMKGEITATIDGQPLTVPFSLR